MSPLDGRTPYRDLEAHVHLDDIALTDPLAYEKSRQY